MAIPNLIRYLKRCLFFACFFTGAAYAEPTVLDVIPSGSLSTWTYENHDPCGGTRQYTEVPSPFDGSTAIQTYMAGCGGTCGSFNMNKEFPFASPLDRSTAIVRFDAEFDLLGNISHNRAQIQFHFYRNGSHVGQVSAGYDRFGQTYNIPAGTFASGTWELPLNTLNDDPDLMRVMIHTRSCVGGNGRVLLDNIQLLGLTEPEDCSAATEQINELQTALDAANENLNVLTGENVALQSEVLLLEDTVNLLDQEVGMLESEAAGLQQEVTDLEVLAADLAGENQTLTSTAAALQAELDDALTGLAEISTLIDTAPRRRASSSDYTGVLGDNIDAIVDKLVAQGKRNKSDKSDKSKKSGKSDKSKKSKKSKGKKGNKNRGD